MLTIPELLILTAESAATALLLKWAIESFPAVKQHMSTMMHSFTARLAFASAVLSVLYAATPAAASSILGILPASFGNVSAVLLKDHLAVIPATWNVSDLLSPFYDIQTNDTAIQAQLNQVKQADFIAFDPQFLDIIGPNARLETVARFPDVPSTTVHEAPTYIADTNQLLFVDTSFVGSVFLLDVATNQLSNATTSPPLHNVNGGTFHRGTIYLTTNGSPVRGIYTFNLTSGTTQPVVNNYRGRKLNSPNDIIVDANNNLWFTDPAYGWYNEWPGVTTPELPNSIYFFNTTSKALVAVSNDVVRVPNGLALSTDGRTLYVSDTNGTSGRPSMKFPDAVRNIYAFDVVGGNTLRNPRMVYQADVGIPDGFRVSRSGLLFAGTGDGVDVVDPSTGGLLGKISTPGDNIFNVQFVPGTGVLFLTGVNNIYKATIQEQGALPL